MCWSYLYQVYTAQRSPSKPPGEEVNADDAKERTDSVHGDNEGPYHGDGLCRWRLVVSVTPATVDEVLNELHRWVHATVYVPLQKQHNEENMDDD